MLCGVSWLVIALGHPYIKVCVVKSLPEFIQYVVFDEFMKSKNGKSGLCVMTKIS